MRTWNPLRLLLSALAVLLMAACAAPHPAPPPADWISWQARRNGSIGGTNGWTALVGLHWLEEGANSTGSAATNQVVLRSASAPPNLGVFTRRGKTVSFTAAEGCEVRVAGQLTTQTEMVTDASPPPTKLQAGSISMIVVERGERVGLRVWDSDAPRRKAFTGLEWFPHSPEWRIEGEFVAFTAPRLIRVPGVTGAAQEFPCPGYIRFRAGGREHRLEAALEPGEPDFFVMFRDRTAGGLTYPTGRFLYVAPPGPGNRVVVDFNRAYTPPCGFTDFATCPLPPRQNWLPLAIRAGELKPRHANGTTGH